MVRYLAVRHGGNKVFNIKLVEPYASLSCYQYIYIYIYIYMSDIRVNIGFKPKRIQCHLKLSTVCFTTTNVHVHHNAMIRPMQHYTHVLETARR